jgi:hypothetical protein
MIPLVFFQFFYKILFVVKYDMMKKEQDLNPYLMKIYR